MESRSAGRFTLGKQSSLAPERDREPEAGRLEDRDGLDVPEEIESGIRLMYLANEDDLAGIRELLASGVDVNFRDIDGRTALHIAACQGLVDVVQLLLENGAEVDPEDRWGSTPFADAIHYKYHEVIKLLERHGAKLRIAPMHVKNAREVPEYEIDPKELDFTKSVRISKGTFQVAIWRGIQVAVKKFGEDVITDEDKVWVGPILSKYFDACFLSTYLLGPSILPFHSISFSICHREPLYEFCRRAFRDELALLQQIRHPNVVQFLGAVTQSSPMMIVTEYLPKGDLCDFLKRRGALKPTLAVRFALDIARGMNYLHEHKPEAIIHRDLEPSNILRDDSGCLKVADFDVSKLLKVTKTVREDRPLTCQNTTCRYVAPEVFRNEEYDTKVDVFSFALILQEMIEGCPPFSQKQDNEVPKAYASKERPPFRAPPKLYVHGLKELIEQCWSESPADRPTFRQIIDRLTVIQMHIPQKRHWKVRFLKCFHKIDVFKKDPSNPSSRSSRSSRSSDFF